MHTVVIGAGFAGLSSACYLAKAGHEVTIIEKNDQVGGRARIWEKDGFRFDMGPSWYWMPDIFEEFFGDFGYTTSDFYQLQRLDPSYRVVMSQEQIIDMPANYSELLAKFEKMEPGSGEKLQKFLKKSEYYYQLGMFDYTRRPSLSVFEFFDLRVIQHALTSGILNSLGKEIDSLFTNPMIRSILKFPVLFLGASANNLPSMYSMMNYTDIKLGTWYPKGGMQQVGKGMATLATKLGVKIVLNSEVKSLKIENSKVTEVITDQKSYAVDGVIGAGDYQFIEQNLLPPNHRRYNQKYWDSRVLAPSSLLFFFGVNVKIPELLHHNLIFDEDFDSHSSNIYDHPTWTEKPLMYINLTSKTDSNTAPEGCENVFVLIPSPAGLDENESIIEHYRNFVIQKIKKYSGVDITNHIVVERNYSKTNFESDYHSYKGNAYGLANTLFQTGPFKPKITAKGLTNFVFAGQLTVPGPGVPPCILSGKIASSLILNQHG